ncbi:MAG: hypothetical protein CMD65_01395 [Gammaproteobacteria bacterium]|nr:hypothetical protein [Gammaproteobacteria bacterium]|tara:strand:- start:445 stop:1044 length:600 start_codon:yes stop_codon:yes gene_type:complete
MNISTCSKCKRLSKNFSELKKNYPNYYNSPINPTGTINSKICIIGLAPGLHGANRTGIPFDGDHTGRFLNKALDFINNKRENIYLTNALKCYPPNNKPLATELKNCLSFLKYELSIMKNLRVILSLGSIAHYSTIKALSLKRSEYKFKHAYIHKIHNNLHLINSYHCSKININNGRLTKKMFTEVVKKSIKIADNCKYE